MKTATRMSREKKAITRPRKPQVDMRGLADFFARQPDVVLAYLFGSVAKGTARKQSDVDVGVLFDPQLDRFERADRFLDLLGRIPSELATHEIDLRSLNDTTPVFLAQVIGFGKPIYARSRREQIDFEVRAMTVYIDTQPLREFFKRKLFQEIGEGNFGRRRRRDPVAVATAQTVPDAMDGHSRA